MEFELEGQPPAGNPAGNLVIMVPGGGWIRPYPALAVGATFTVAFPSPPHDFNEIVWPEVPEIAAWSITWSNFTAFTIGVDDGISETKDPDGDQPVTQFDFVTGDPLPDSAVVVEFVYEGSGTPSLTQWGLIILLIIMASIATWVVFKKRRVVAV
jgi:hypothetical protein